jgi:HlyD family secretion protein
MKQDVFSDVIAARHARIVTRARPEVFGWKGILMQLTNDVGAPCTTVAGALRRWILRNWMSDSTRLALAALLAVTAVTACTSGEAAESIPANEIEAVGRRDLQVVAEASGQVEPIRVVEVKSKASGEILNLPVETGDLVERGALLAEVDPRDVQASFEQAEADSAVAQARYDNSVAQLERAKELRVAGFATDQELETAQLDEANSRAALIRAVSSLQLAHERRNDVTIRAPISGVVIERPVEIGTIIASASQNVSGGTILMKMADLATMQVRALIDETDLGRIRQGLDVVVRVEAYPERTFNGNVMKIEPQAVVEQNVTMFPVLVQLDNTSGLLKVGMNADIEVQIASRENVIVVPNSAVVATRDAAAAGMVLGISEDDIRAAMRSPTQATASGGETGGEGISEECVALMSKMREGGIQGLSDEDRTKLRDCGGQQFAQGGQQGDGQQAQGGRQGGRQGRGGNRQGGLGGPRGGGSQPGQQRTGIVFVTNETGAFEPRFVTLGVNDWEFTEVIRGVEEGDQVVIISVARLQQSQQEFLDRIRERTGGNGPIPGGTPRGGGRGR